MDRPTCARSSTSCTVTSLMGFSTINSISAAPSRSRVRSDTRIGLARGLCLLCAARFCALARSFLDPFLDNPRLFVQQRGRGSRRDCISQLHCES